MLDRFPVLADVGPGDPGTTWVVGTGVAAAGAILGLAVLFAPKVVRAGTRTLGRARRTATGVRAPVGRWGARDGPRYDRGGAGSSGDGTGAVGLGGVVVAVHSDPVAGPGEAGPACVTTLTPPPVAALSGLTAAAPAGAPGLPRAAEDWYRALFDCNPHPMWVFDAESLRFLAVNDAALRKYGYARDELLTLTVRDVCPAEGVDRLVGPVADPPAVDGQTVLWQHRTKLGVVLDAEATTHRLRFDGRPARLILVGDGADRRRAAATLREREELLRNVIAHIPGGVFWKDRASIYLGCNDQVVQDFGLVVPGEVVGRTDFDMAADPQEAEASRTCDRRVMETGRPLLNQEETRTLPGGERRTVLASRVPLRGAGGATGVLGVYLDITERKQLEEQYRQAAKMEAVGRLAGGIAHDFNNLLTVIRGNAELLLAAADSPDGVRMVDEVRMAADRAAGLVRQLLTFSRPQSVRLKVVDLNGVVADLSGILRRLLGAVTVDVEASPVPVPVLADRGQLEQVVMNLAVNARDAMPGGGRLRLAVAEAPDGPGRLARLSVSDTGTGMTDEVRARIFDPFFTTKGPDKGTGLGLAVVHGIVRQAGGAISVASAPGAGTTFHIDLPWADSLPSPSTAMSVRATTRRVPGGQGRTVLLVEDEDGIRALARLTLEGRGFAVTEAPDGVAALDILAAGRTFDLVVTDMTMPGVGGTEVAGRAAQVDPTVRVVYMSGYVPDDDRLAEPPGAVFLPKPFTPADLVRATDLALTRDPASRELRVANWWAADGPATPGA
ncbi:MAG: Blue-light-activated protein [Gemmataceae bacterium]|nr:Blue-light-activated protein [Gemmataceae bacterium]